MAEGVLTPAALHLRAAAGKTGPREGGSDGGVAGPRATMSHTSLQSGDGESSSAATPTCVFAFPKCELHASCCGRPRPADSRQQVIWESLKEVQDKVGVVARVRQKSCFTGWFVVIVKGFCKITPSWSSVEKNII